MVMKYYIFYIVIINIITLLNYGIDKRNAIKGKRRISEATLYILSIIGGPVGAIIGMYLFHHKTKKIKFYLINVCTLCIWIYLSCRLAILTS